MGTRGDSKAERMISAARLTLMISLLGMIGIFIAEIARGEKIAPVSVLFSVIWMVWVVYALWKSKLFKQHPEVLTPENEQTPDESSHQ
jgi:hypothetical protein